MNSVVVISCRTTEGRHSFLFGIGGEGHAGIALLRPGDQVRLERSGADILVNRIPVRKFYRRTLDGLVELAGAGWKRFKARTPKEEIAKPAAGVETEGNYLQR